MTLKESETEALKSIFGDFPEIKLAYFFGSQAEGKGGPLSDYDFAVYMDKCSKKKAFEIRLILMDRISRLLKTDKVDVVVLNFIEGPEIKYHIIAKGKLIFEREPYKVLIEPKILNEYFDFHQMLLRNNLTRAE